MRAWRRRGQRVVIGLLTPAVALLALIVVQAVRQSTEDPLVTERLAVLETSFDIAPADPDDLQYTVSVQVDFCAGSDTDFGGLPPETQRTVSPDDFVLFDANGAAARLIDSADQLRTTTLRRGDYTTGDLTFRALHLSDPRLAYTNEVGDDVIWYRYGHVPQQ
ncbi:MAG: hypothetical protein ACTMIR_00345 [Cellulomonadaceae bacterium]